MRYLEGYSEALREVQAMGIKELFEHMSGLYGAQGFTERDSIEDIRREAIRQTKLDWLDASDPNYQQNRKILIQDHE